MSELDHHRWMREALALAARAGAMGEVPVGAVIVHCPFGEEGKVIGSGFNEREIGSDPSAHAEIVAMRMAGRMLGHWRLTDCTMYVTLEPCPMCAGAAVQARLTRLVYGARDPKAGAVETLYRLCSDERLNHRVEVIGGVMGEEAGALLKGFFAERRASKASER
ncbi:MAG: tRNA adenosine(34) deaminase TadA [Phycisphaerales bacterium]|nr:tRNA adenosine(34) deaminase TadA [Phycisphaerales bacterium]